VPWLGSLGTGQRQQVRISAAPSTQPSVCAAGSAWRRISSNS